MGERRLLHKILLPLAGFVFLWATVTDAWGYSEYLFRFRNGNYVYAYLSRLIWVFPALFLIFKYSDLLKFSRRQLFSPISVDRLFITVIIASLICVIMTMLARHRGFWFCKTVNLPLEIVKLIVVGFVEETVFRGWGYNALAKVIPERKAIMISTALFVLLHWPAYFIRFYRFGTFDFSGIVLQSFSAFVWGIIGCRLLKSGKSLWNPIIAHSFYDIATVLFVG